MLAIKAVANEASQVSQSWRIETEFTATRTGALVRSLGFDPHRIGTGFQFEVTRAKLAELTARYQRATWAAAGP